MRSYNIIALSGSTRRGSFNTALLKNIQSMAPAEVSIQIYEGLQLLPFYSEELDGEHLHPEAKKLRQALAESDGVLLAVPEYNYSFTALTKNALDWASRPAGKHAFVGKPTALVGASSSLLGTIRAQLHTREVLHALQADVLSRPEVFVAQASSKFDSEGNLTDETTTTLIRQLVDNLITKIREREDSQADLGDLAS